jgi:hypothetical protein
MAFYECFTLKLRQRFSVFIGLVLPHATHRWLADAPETVNLQRFMGEMFP